jgi:hypothetical protein
LLGRILDEDGKPVVDARVRVFYADNGVGWLSETVVGEIQTDAEGRFRLEGLIPGLNFGIGFRKGANFLDAGQILQKLTVEPGEAKSLGDIPTKVYRLP